VLDPVMGRLQEMSRGPRKDLLATNTKLPSSFDAESGLRIRSARSSLEPVKKAVLFPQLQSRCDLLIEPLPGHAHAVVTHRFVFAGVHFDPVAAEGYASRASEARPGAPSQFSAEALGSIGHLRHGTIFRGDELHFADMDVVASSGQKRLEDEGFGF